MTRASTALAVCSLLLAACPVTPGAPDGDVGFDAGNPSAIDACSGGCAANQRCDTAKRECVDGCGGCDAGLCVKGAGGAYLCQASAVSCAGTTCAPGQIACVGGACSCITTANGAGDSCASLGQWCASTSCVNPGRYEQCLPEPGAPGCPAGHVCDPIFGADQSICVKRCGVPGAICDRGELCTNLTSGPGCLPLGLFVNQECTQNVRLADGGLLQADGGAFVQVIVPVSNTCLLKDPNGHVLEDAGAGSGTCTAEYFKFWDQGLAPSPTCRPPGSALEGQACKKDLSLNAGATQCSTGLQCMLTGGADAGVCLRVCNANPPTDTIPSTPGCSAGEACANLFRTTDQSNNAVLGACLKTCNVFDPVASACAPVGLAASSCVPTTPGTVLVSSGGEGLCVPQQGAVSGLGQPCTTTDPFHGAACASGQVCTSLDPGVPATCTGTCDLDCNPPDGGTGPTRCAAEVNTRCAAGKQCKRVTTSAAAHLGFCL